MSITTSILTARLLGPEGRGIYSLIITAFNIGIILFGLGVPQFTACYAGKKEFQVATVIFNGFLIVGLGSAVVALGAVILFLNPELVPEDWNPSLIFLLAVALSFGLLGAHVQSILQGLNRMMAYNIVRAGSQMVSLPLLFLALCVFNAGLIGALLAWTGGLVLSTVLGMFFVRTRILPLVQRPSIVFVRSLQFGLRAMSAQIVGTLNQRFDFFLVGLFVGSAGVGHYSVAVVLATLLWYLPASIGSVLIPKLSNASPSYAAGVTARLIRITFAYSVIGAVSFAFLIPPLIPLVYGSAYESAVVVFLWLLPGTALYSLAHVTTSYFYSAVDRPLINTGLAALSLIIDLILNLMLTPTWGVPGAAVAATVSYGVSVLVALIWFCKFSGQRLHTLFVLTTEDISLARELLDRLREGMSIGKLRIEDFLIGLQKSLRA